MHVPPRLSRCTLPLLIVLFSTSILGCGATDDVLKAVGRRATIEAAQKANEQIENSVEPKIKPPGRKSELLSCLRVEIRNCAGADLSGLDLSGLDLTDLDLSNSNLSRSVLVGSNLTGANLTGADLSWVNLSDAKIVNAILDRAILTGARMPDGTIHD
jgi:uncharacterized protein YjbI with pentapeptide repeats